jgi:hypothetical protein
MLTIYIGMSTELRQITPTKFRCEVCDVSCSHKSDWTRHISTLKHKNQQLLTKTSETSTKNECGCGRVYKERSGLWRHAKKCLGEKPARAVENTNMDLNFLTNLVLEIVKNNAELQKRVGHNTINSHNNNKTFNLQFFLNEQCKDAMNIMDFVDSFKLQFADLEQVGEVGYIEGISNIIIKKLNEMDIHKRPIHCSDAKRETLYVKDDNVWEKENATCDKLRRAIKYISKKNSDLIPAWNVHNPLANNFASHVNDQYLSIIKQAMGGSGEVIDSENKIIRKLAKSVLIEKL